MKKRILSALMAIMVSMSSIGAVSVMAEKGDLILSDTTTVNVENTETCYAKVTDSEYHADSNYYLHFKAGAADWLEVSQSLTEEVTAGSTYILTVVAKPVSGKVWFRVGWDDTGWLVSNQAELATELEDGWFKYEKEITMTKNQSNVLFHNEGEAEIYVDSISLKPVGEDKELLVDSDFDVVSYDAETDACTTVKTTVNVPNTETCFVEVIRSELPAENEYSLHLYSEGEWLEVSQNLTEVAVAGEQYVLTAYVKPVTGRVWFYVDWDATGWMATHAADVIAPQPDGWTMVQKTITMTEDKAKLLFHNDNATEMYIDDISLVAVGGTENLVPDGGFGEVTIEGSGDSDVPSAGVPDEDLVLSSTTTVNVENTDTVYAKVTDDTKNSGSYSMHFKSDANHLEVSQRLLESAVAGEKYMISAYVKPVSGQLWFRLGWDNDAWMVADTTHGTDWVKVEKEITVAGNEGDLNTILFHNSGETEFYIDDLSLVKVGSETELVPDGGFEEVTLSGSEEPPVVDPDEPDEPTVNIPDEDLVLSGTTTVNVENTDTVYAKVTDDTKNSGSYSMHFKSDANHLEVSQRLLENAVAGEKYMISAYVKPVSGQLWFRLGWDNDAWMVADTTLGTDWVKVEKEITVAGNEGDLNTILFHNSGETEFYIDDLSLVKVGSETELVPDGGFEDVTVFHDIPDENLILSDTTHLNMENTDACYAKVTDNEKSEGNYSLHFKAGASDWLEVDQTLTAGATAGSKYILSASVKVVTGKVWFRVDWDDTGWLVSTQTELGTDLGNGWIKLTKEITLTGDQTKLLFHNEGEAEMYIDDISLVAVDGTENLVPDGGFEDVTVFVDVPDEKLVLSNKTSVNQENTETCFAKVTDNEKNSGSYSLHFKTGAEDWLEVSQRLIENAVTGSTYILSATVKVVTGKVWFRLGWDDDAWLVSTQTDLGTDEGNGWIKLVKEVTVKGNDGDLDTILFHNDGATEMYIDDLSLVKVGETTELVPDGGFEDVIVACDNHTWDEGVVTLEPTVDAEGVKTFTCSGCGETKTEAIEKLPAPSYTPGDANGDIKIDVKDVIAIRRHIAGGYGVTINEAAANVNGDTKIDVKDAIAIRRYIAGGYGVELQ